jgi:hypothetical protein
MTFFARFAFTGCLAVALVGCGDDTQTAADLAVAHDMAVAGGGASCADYCGKIAMTCQSGDGGATLAQYPSTAACLTYCTTTAAWPAGTTGATVGNTVACRLYHAGAAAADPVTHCPHAGPTGGDVCGSYCENYCQLMAKNCTGGDAVYDAATCMTKCATIPTNGSANDTSGNTIQCRITQLGLAAADPALNCPHAKTASDLPGGPCT